MRFEQILINFEVGSKMKSFKNIAQMVAAASLLVTTVTANAGLITNLAGAGKLTGDYNQETAGSLAGMTGGSSVNSFNGADFGASTDASRDNATFKVSIDNLTANTTAGNQFLFEFGGTGTGIALWYNASNEITFAHKQGSTTYNEISFDVSSLFGEYIDIYASISLDDNLMSLFIGDEPNFFSKQINASGNLGDWDGSNGGAFGVNNGSFVSGAAFTSGGTSTFKYYHDTFVDVAAVPEPTTLAIFALGVMGLAARRFKKQS